MEESLQSLINKHSGNLDIHNKRSIIQRSVIDIPRNIKEEDTTSKHFKANGNAQILEFFTMVGEMVENVLATQANPVLYEPNSKAFFPREDADQRFKCPIITFSTVSRKIKEGTSKVPMLRESMFEKDDDRTCNVYTICYESIIRFRFLALEYETAYNLMMEFENMMEEYRYHIKQQGVVNYYLLEQKEDEYSVDFRDLIDILTLDYYVETQKNRVIFKENDKTLVVSGEATNEDFSPIPTAPQYIK